jgi:hypothetical protein
VGIAIAFAASFLAGSSAGTWYATYAGANGVRPRRLLRENLTAARRLLAVTATAGIVAAVGGVAAVEHLRWALAVTCAAASILFAVAAWLVAVEPDEDGDVELSDEPAWWPEFERDLSEWRTRSRIPAGPRA